MVLGVNGIRLVGKRSGVGRCIQSLLASLGELDHPFTDVKVYTPVPLDDDIKLPDCARNVVLRSKLSNALWEQITLPMAHGSKHLLLCPSYVSPLFARCPTFLIHQGSYEAYPEAFSWWVLNKARAIYTASAWRSTAMSTVSEQSKKDIIHFYKVRPDKINVIPEGVDTSLFEPIFNESSLSEWRKSTLGEDSPYILYVGKPTKRRNLRALLEAFRSLKNDTALPHKMVFVGTALPGFPLDELVKEMKLEDQVVTIDYLSHDDVALAYNAADLFVYPSSYEGFGMPVLESMACGTPTITLNNTAFPEFASGVAMLLPDAQPETLRDGMVTALTDSTLRKQMKSRGPERAAKYDWKLITRRYLDVMIPLAK
jgi:glycosyltransferase involved in cell wall biosynthesis